MHNQLKIFEKAEFGSVRVVMKEDEPWFVAKDVCNALGYVWKGVATIGHIPEEWRGVYSVQTPSGEQEMLILSESGLYFFLGRSDKPAALPYQKWIAGDVVPTIRKTGHYGEWNLPRIPKSFPDALRMIADIEEEKQLAIEQRDYYRRTKAQIGIRREALTGLPISGILNFPNRTGVTVALAWPHQAVKSGLFCSCHRYTSSGCGHILARRRPGVREAPAAVRAGERRLAFFCAQNPKSY